MRKLALAEVVGCAGGKMKPQDWQPWETVPKTGEWIFAYDKKYSIYVVERMVLSWTIFDSLVSTYAPKVGELK